MWDRAKFQALSCLVKAWHGSQEYAATEDMSGQLLSLTQFTVTNACSCHDVHKAMEWAMFFEYANKELLRDIHVAVESVRNSMDLFPA